MGTAFRITPLGEFSLAASIDFLAGFTPADYQHNGGADHQPGSTAEDDADLAETPVLRLAFGIERGGPSVGVAFRQGPTGVVLADVQTADGAELSDSEASTARQQLARILSLDVDARALTAVVAADLPAKALVNQCLGLRPVCFNSPYEAACWAVLSQRVRMTQAASTRTGIARELGVEHEVAGLPVAAFPTPSVVLAAGHLPGVAEIKADRLRAVAQATLDGLLDGEHLRSLEPGDAIEQLCTIAGVGPFSAELILVRGAGYPDLFPRNETRLHREMARVYGVPADDVDQLARIAEGWRPFRSWVSFFFRSQAEPASGRQP